MIPALLILIPLLTGGLCLLLRARAAAVRWTALVGTLLNLALAVFAWLNGLDVISVAWPASWAAQVSQLRLPWIPQFGITVNLSADGLSQILVVLTALLAVVSVAASWRGITHRVGFFHFNLLLVIAGITGVFESFDLFLFYFFWELMLVPMYFLIDIWGHENRHYAAIKFFIFTQVSGLLMLVSILGLVIVHARATGVYTFDYDELIGTPMSAGTGFWLMLGFAAAFLVKLPAVPFHTWLPDAHTEAPTAGSVILAGLLLKTGAYGLLRFVVPLFPAAALDVSGVARVLGTIGILYGAIMAFAQTDLKRLVAYTSVSHMGFVLLGVFTWNELAFQGVVMQMLCHGLSTGGLFVLAGSLSDRLGTRDMRLMGGLWASAPKMGASGMFLAMATLGLPGMGNFVGEILVLLGVYQVSPVIAIVASVGLVLSTVYALWMIQQTFHGREKASISDLGRGEVAVMAVLVLLLLGLGLYPRPIFRTIEGPMAVLQPQPPCDVRMQRSPVVMPAETPAPAAQEAGHE